MAAGLQLHLLGPPEIILQQARLSFSRRKAVALLAYLAVSGRPASREILANLLAGKTTDDLARQHVRNALRDLSSQLGDYLIVSRQTIAFNRALPYQLDIEEFQRLAGNYAQGADDGRLAQAIALYRGDLLAGFALRQAPAFDEWLAAERDRLRVLAIHALQTLLARAENERSGVGGPAVGPGPLAIDPARVAIYRQLMQQLERAGQDERALQPEDWRDPEAATQQRGDPPPARAATRQGRAAPISNSELLRVTPKRPREMPQELVTLVEHLADADCRLIVLLTQDRSDIAQLVLKAIAYYRSIATPPSSHLFPDGIYLVSALREHKRGTVAEPSKIGSNLAVAIANALGKASAGVRDPTPQLLEQLKSQNMLVVVDRLKPEEADIDLVAAILNNAPQVKLVVISGQPLDLQEEWVLEIR